MQNRYTREFISARKTSHKHNEKDLGRLRQLSAGVCVNYKVRKPQQRHITSPGMCVNTRSVNSTRGTSSGRFMDGCTSGGVSGPRIYTHARWELPKAMTQVFTVVLV